MGFGSCSTWVRAVRDLLLLLLLLFSPPLRALLLPLRPVRRRFSGGGRFILFRTVGRRIVRTRTGFVVFVGDLCRLCPRCFHQMEDVAFFFLCFKLLFFTLALLP